jgi:RcsF lipoprotein
MEKFMIRFYVVVTCILLSACAGFGQVERVADLSPQELKNLRTIKFYESDNNMKYTSLGRIKGVSCKGSAMSGDTKEDAAMTQLKIKAVKINANAIFYSTCSHDASVDWGNNCWESWVCVGEAARIE